MSRKRQVITPGTPFTLSDWIITITFWSLVIGWPLFVVLYRWLD